MKGVTRILGVCLLLSALAAEATTVERTLELSGAT